MRVINASINSVEPNFMAQTPFTHMGHELKVHTSKKFYFSNKKCMILFTCNTILVLLDQALEVFWNLNPTFKFIFVGYFSLCFLQLLPSPIDLAFSLSIKSIETFNLYYLDFYWFLLGTFHHFRKVDALINISTSYGWVISSRSLFFILVLFTASSCPLVSCSNLATMSSKWFECKVSSTLPL